MRCSFCISIFIFQFHGDSSDSSWVNWELLSPDIEFSQSLTMADSPYAAIAHFNYSCQFSCSYHFFNSSLLLSGSRTSSLVRSRSTFTRQSSIRTPRSRRATRFQSACRLATKARIRTMKCLVTYQACRLVCVLILIHSFSNCTSNHPFVLPNFLQYLRHEV